MSTRIFLLLALFFAFFSQALTLEQEMSFWTKEGETANATDFVGDGSVLLVRVNGVESAFIVKVGSDYIPVDNEKQIEELIGKYQKYQFQNYNVISNVQLVKDKYANVSKGLEDCAYGAEQYVLFKSKAWPFSLVWRSRVDFPTEYSGYVTLNYTYLPFKSSVENAKKGVDEMYAASQAEDISRTFVGIQQARASIDEINTNYSRVYAAYYNITYKYFPYAFWHGGKEYKCAPEKNVTDSLGSVLSLIPEANFKSDQVLLNSITGATKERVGTVKERHLAATQTERIQQLLQQIANLSTKFSALGGSSPTALENEAKALNNSVNKVDFDKKYDVVKNKTAKYENVYADYDKSVKALNNATAQINAAAKKYGSNDDRIVEMQKTTQALRTSLKQSETAVRNDNLTAVVFQGIAQNATAIALRAGRLGPKESQIDFVTIGGILVLLLAVVGAVWYFKKTRGGGQTPTPVDVRDLMKQSQQQPPQ